MLTVPRNGRNAIHFILEFAIRLNYLSHQHNTPVTGTSAETPPHWTILWCRLKARFNVLPVKLSVLKQMCFWDNQLLDNTVQPSPIPTPANMFALNIFSP